MNYIGSVSTTELNKFFLSTFDWELDKEELKIIADFINNKLKEVREMEQLRTGKVESITKVVATLTTCQTGREVIKSL